VIQTTTARDGTPPKVLELIESGLEVRPVPGFPGYWASDDGQVIEETKGTLKQHLVKSGKHDGGHKQSCYFKVWLYGPNGKRWYPAVHQVVLLAFDGPRPKGMESRHLDSNPFNNHYSNLAYGTQAENNHDRAALGPHSTGVPGVVKVQEWHREAPTNKGKYRAAVRHNGKRIYLGFFDTIEEAEGAIKAWRKAREVKTPTTQ